MSFKSVTQMAASEVADPPSQNLVKSYDMGGEVGIPKSWFNDPYAMLDSMGLGYRSAPSSLTFETMKQMAEKNTIVSSIIQTRLNQVASFCQPQLNKYSIGFKVAHRNQKHKLTESEKEHVADMERFVLNMGADKNSERDSFEMWVRKVVRDRLTYDQMCSEKILRRNGKPHSIYAVPADTIRFAAPKNKRATPLTKAQAWSTPKYVQVIDGTVVNEYTSKEFMFRVANPRTDLRTHNYGLSELELLVTTITSHLWAEEWNRKVFSQGSTIKGILNIKGNIPSAQIEAFKRQWMTQVSGVTNAWKTPVMNSDDMQWIPLQPSNNDMGFQQWLEYLVKVACAVYLIDPAEINFDTRGGVGSQPMFMSTNEAQQKVSKDRGLQPLLRFIQNTVNEEILWEIDDDYQFLFVGLDARTESEAIELRMKELSSYKTLNEIRREADELPPTPDGDIVLNPVYVGYKQQQAAQQAQAQAGAAGGAGGMPGMPPGAGAPNGAPPSQKEMFEGQFGGGAPGGAEQALAGKMQKDLQTPKEEDSDEGHEDENPFTAWDGGQTLQASLRMGKLNSRLSSELKKALAPFEGI